MLHAFVCRGRAFGLRLQVLKAEFCEQAPHPLSINLKAQDHRDLVTAIGGRLRQNLAEGNL